MLKPYDIDNLAVGSVRVLRAPLTEAVPGDISDVIDMEAPYDPVGDWEDFGAAKGSTTYNRGMESEGIAIQQVDGNVIEEITDVIRKIATSVAEIEPNNVGVLEESSGSDAIAAAAGRSAQVAVPFGTFSELTHYRIALLGVRKTQSGVVTESSGSVRGRFFMVVLYNTTMTADDVEIEFEKGSLAEASVEWTAFPEETITAAEEAHGTWFFEDAGTIAGS